MLEDKGVKRSEKIEKIVRPATEAGWHTVCTNATSRTVAYRESFHTHMELIAQHEKSIRDQILGKIGPTLESFLAQKQITALKPIMETLMDPLTQAFGEAVRSFFTILSTKSLVKDLDGREKRTGTFASLVYGLEYHLQSDSLLFWSSQILNNMFSDPFTISIFLKSKYPYLIVARECIDTVGSVLYRALNTYEVALNDAIEHPHTAYISRLLTVISQLVHDSKRLLRGIAHKIMHSILRSYILAQLPQYQTEVADLNFTQGIPPELQLYFDSERMLLNTVFEFTDKFVTDFLTPFFMDCDTSIDGIEKELIALGNNEPSTNVNRASVNRLSTKHMSLSATRQPSTGTSSATATRLLTPDVIQTPDLGRSSFEQRNNKPLRTSGGALRTSLKSSNTPSPMSSPVSPHKSAIGVALPGLSIRPPLSPVGRVVEDSVGKIDSQGGEAVSIEKKEKTTNELMEENAKALSDLAL